MSSGPRPDASTSGTYTVRQPRSCSRTDSSKSSVTDASGNVRFSTIYPGWYAGRAVHVHFKIRSNAGAVSRFEFTSQLYFDESITDLVHAQAPYNTHGRRDTTNQRDGIFASGGPQLMLNLSPEGAGYAGTFDIALQV